MKITNVTDVDAFFKVVDSCKGRVELVSDVGDRLNLKSKLTQYISLAKLFSDGFIREMDLVVYEQDDIQKFIKFMMNGR